MIHYIKRENPCGKGRDFLERERATAVKKLFIRMRKQELLPSISKQTYLCLYLYLTPFM